MVCHLSGTMQIGALTTTSAEQWCKWHECDGRQDPPPDKRNIASALELFERLVSASKRIEHNCGRVIEITDKQKKAFKCLHQLRNQFVHFSPKSWSIEIEWIKAAVPDMLDIIAQTADDTWSFRHLPDGESDLLKDNISDLRNRLCAITSPPWRSAGSCESRKALDIRKGIPGCH